MAASRSTSTAACERRTPSTTSSCSTPTCSPLRDWLACLQHATSVDRRAGVAGAKLLYPDNRIQYAGTIRNAQAPEWFDHRYRGKPADWGPADVPGPTLAATGACMYIRRDALDAIGLLDEAYGMGYEDVDYGLRAWQAGYEVAYVPSSRLYHHESATRGTASASASSGRSACSGSAGRRSSGRARYSPTTAGCASCTSPRARSSAAVTASSSSTSTDWPTEVMTSRCGRSRPPPTGSSCAAPCALSPTMTSSRRRSRRSRPSRSRPGGTPRPQSGEPVCCTASRSYFVQDIETSYYPRRPDAPP